jgi:hypothetical protein
MQKVITTARGPKPDFMMQLWYVRHMTGINVDNSLRYISLKSRKGSSAPLSSMSRNSGSVLFGKTYVSTIMRTNLSARSAMRGSETTLIY